MASSLSRGKIRVALAALAAAVAVLAAAPTALALSESTTPTSQARAYAADWVPYLDPPQQPAAVCLVDSGVNVTPDTPADSPNGPIVARTALDGGSGEGGGDDAHLHGTYMAMEAAAPPNGWGTVGFWPGARIYSVRAMPVDQTTFPFDVFTYALDQCSAAASTYNIVAINLSLGCDCSYDSGSLAKFENKVAQVHKYGLGLDVVAAAGNNAGPIGMPAAVQGVLSVGAGDHTGALCSYSNRGAALGLIAPGCELDGAWPTSGAPFVNWLGGTSPAAASTSTALALLRSYRPDLAWQDAEQLLRGSARRTPDGPVLDLEAAFRAAGLGAAVDAAKAREPQPAPTPGPSSSAGTGVTTSPPTMVDDVGGIWLDAGTSRKGRLPTPKLDSVLRIGVRLTLSVRNRPRGARLVLLLQRRASEFSFATLAKARRTADTLTLRLPRRWRGGRVVVRYELAKHPDKTSLSLYRWVGG